MSDQAIISSAPVNTRAATRRWRTEDWIAVVLGFLVIVATLVVFQWKIADLRNIVPNLRWTTDSQITSLTPDWTVALDNIAKDAAAKGQKNIAALSTDLKAALASKNRKAIEDAAAKLASAGGRTVAGALAGEIRGHAAASEAKVFAADNLLKVLYVGIGVLLVASLGTALLGSRVLPFVIGLPVIFALAWAARLLAGNGLFVNWGIEYVIFALLIGLLISNTVGTPEWLKPAVQTELFIKTGLVILGASLLFYEVLQAGALGLVQAVLVVFVVWYACFWLCGS